MRRLVAAAAVVCAACGVENVDPGHGAGAGGSGGGGVEPVAQALQLPTCTTSLALPLDCGAEACAGESSHGLDVLFDMALDSAGNTYLVGAREIDWRSGIGEFRISRLDGGTWRLLPPLPESFRWHQGTPLALAASNPHDVWVSNMREVARFDGAGWTTFPMEGIVMSLAAEGPGSTWATDFRSLYHFDGSSWQPVTRYAGSGYVWRASTLRLVGDRVELGGVSISSWDGVHLEEHTVLGDARLPAGAEGWATSANGLVEFRDGAWQRHRLDFWPESLAVFRGAVLLLSLIHI